MEQYEPDLVVEEIRSLPAPLDRNIASIKVWTDANDPTDGFDILITASVGTDIIELSVENSTIEVQVEIYQAEVSVEFANCSPTFGSDHAIFFGQGGRTYEEQIKMSDDLESSGNAKISNSPSLGYAQTRRATVHTQRNTGGLEIDFEHHDFNGLRFGNWQAKETLVGQFVPQYRGWRAKHDASQELSGVLAALQVKKNWLEFKRVKPIGESRVAKILRSISGSSDESDQLKAKLFSALLKELTIVGLQRNEKSPMATLAMSGFIVRTKDGTSENLLSKHERAKIEIPEALLLGLLHAPNGKEQEAFESAKRAARSAAPRPVDDFTPQSGYLDARQAYFELAIEFRSSGQPFSVDHLMARYGDPVISDLRKLGAITSDRKNTAYFTSPYPYADPESAFQALVRSKRTIQKTEEILLSDPDSTGLEIGKIIGDLLSRKWTDGSAKRYGNQLKSWARQKQSLGHGRSRKISEMNEKLVVEMHSQGRTNAEIAELIGAAPETVGRHLRRRKSLKGPKG